MYVRYELGRRNLANTCYVDGVDDIQKNKYNIIKQEYGIYSIFIVLTYVEASKCHKSGRLETLHLREKGFPKLIPEAVRNSDGIPASARIPQELPQPLTPKIWKHL